MCYTWTYEKKLSGDAGWWPSYKLRDQSAEEEVGKKATKMKVGLVKLVKVNVRKKLEKLLREPEKVEPKDEAKAVGRKGVIIIKNE